MSNSTGASISVSAGTRLILASDPVTVYSNATGSTSTPVDLNSVATDDSDPITGGVWIPRPQFDQVGAIEVAVDSVSSVAHKSGTGATLSWTHNAGGSDRLVLVGISWKETSGSAGDETLDSVTYDGTAMTLVASAAHCDLYSLVNPPTGSKTIVVTWSGTDNKGAVAAAISFNGVNQSKPLEAAVTAGGSSTAPSVTLLAGLPSTIFTLIGVDSVSSTVTLTAGSGATERWNDNIGSLGSTLVQGGASTRNTGGAARAMQWTLSASRSWGLIAVPIRPKVLQASLSIPGGLTTTPNFVDARNYADLQAAADDVAPGGTLSIPNGDYSVPSGGLIIRKSLLIRGEPGTRLFSYSNGTNQPVLVISPGGHAIQSVTISDLQLLNASKPEVPASGNYGIHCDIPADGSKLSRLVIERVSVLNMGDHGISLDAHGEDDSFIVFATLRDVSCVEGLRHGLYATYTNLLNCFGCYFAANLLNGARIEISEAAFYACAFESNCRHELPDEELESTPALSALYDGQLVIRDSLMSRVDGCHFESFNTEDQPLCKRGIVLVNSPCTIISGCSFLNGAESDDPYECGIFCTFNGDADEPAPGVVACAILPNVFTQTKTAIEIDGGAGLAQDCSVFSQRVTSGTGAMVLPTGINDSGLMVLGNRKLGTGSASRGLFVPRHTSSGLPSLTSAEAGYMLHDSTNHTLAIWDGVDWRTVTLNP